MRALDLDLARRRPSWPAWLLLATGIAVAGDALYGFVGARGEVARLQQRVAGTVASTPPPKAPVDERTRRELDAARQALLELALPWEPLFQAIEASIGSDTALLAIEPDAGRRSVRISGEARDYLAILSFMQRLETPGVLTGVHLLNHQIRDDVTERPYQFTLAAGWRIEP